MSAEQPKHDALSEENKLKEKIFLAWWKQKLNAISDMQIFEGLYEKRDGEYKKSVDDLERLCTELRERNDDSRRDGLLREFSEIAMKIAIEEFDTVSNEVANEVFDQNDTSWMKCMGGFVESECEYRHGR
jgi:hypothetical protein